MKTGYEWLETLPEVVKLQALENCKEQDKEYRLNLMFDSLDNCITTLFSWRYTPEKIYYWDSISQGIIPVSTKENEYLIVWFNDEKNIHSTGKNYTGINAKDALEKFYNEHPNAYFHSMSIKKW